MKTKRFLAYNPESNEYERFTTIEEARNYLESGFIDDYNNTYHPDTEDFQIWELREIVKLKSIDSKENYEDSEKWPHDYDFDVICEHKFVDARKKFSFKGRVTQISKKKP